MSINILYVLLKFCVKKFEYDWNDLSKNPYVNSYIIEEFINCPWKWEIICEKQFITWDLISKCENKNDQLGPGWVPLSRHPNITWDIIKKNPKCPWKWRQVSANPNITWDIIQSYPNKPWNWAGISANINITWDIVISNQNKPWNWYVLSANPSITWRVIRANGQFPWKYWEMSTNPNITWDCVEEWPKKPWNIHSLFRRLGFPPFSKGLYRYSIGACLCLLEREMRNRRKPGFFARHINWKIIEKYPELSWNFWSKYISKMSTITMAIIEQNPEFPWDWNQVSKNPNLTWDMVRKYPDKGWDFKAVLKNSFIPREFLDALLNGKIDEPMMWSFYSRNPNFTFDDLKGISQDKKRQMKWKLISKHINLQNQKEEIYDTFSGGSKADEGYRWNWGFLSKNGSISPDLIFRFKDHIWWIALSGNKFKIWMCIRIQRFWRRKGAFPTWKRAIKKVNDEILFSPYIPGIKFKKIINSVYGLEPQNSP